MLGISKIRQLQQMVQNPHESEMMRSYASIVAHLEHDLLGAVEDLHDAQGIENGVEVNQSVEERVDALLDVAEAAAGGDFERYWFGEVAGFENAEDVAAFAGLSEEAWHDQMDTWVDRYREKAPEEFADQSDREVVAWHVEGEYGVPLEEFEREVVGYRRRDALRAALAGNISAGIEGVRMAARHARADGDGAAEDVPEHGGHPNSPQPADGGSGDGE